MVSSDRGLCGGLNNSLFKLVVENVEQDRSSNISTSFSLIGGKASSFFQKSAVMLLLKHLSWAISQRLSKC